MKPASFGSLLRQYRTAASHPKSGHPLTQERLAELMDVSVGTIHNWERNRRQIRADDREQLLRLLSALHTWSGINTKDEANELLLAGGYRRLDKNETNSFFADLPDGNDEGDISDEIDDEIDEELDESDNEGAEETEEEVEVDGGDDNNRTLIEVNEGQKELHEMISSSNPSQILTKSTIRSILTGPDWPEDESRVAAIILHLMGYPFDNFSAGQAFRLAVCFLIWIFSSAIWVQALRWPFANQADVAQAWSLWGSMAVIAPALLGMVVKADRQENLIMTTRATRSIAIIRLSGAMAGHLIGSVIVLLIVLGMFFLGLWPLAPWLVAGFAGLPLLIGYAGAKRMPLNHYRAFPPKSDETDAFRLGEGDWVMLFAFVALGPGLATIFAVGQPWTWPPLIGGGILGTAFMGAAALQLMARRMGEEIVPAWLWALVLGVPLGLQMSIRPEVEPLLGMGLIAGLAVLALEMKRQDATPSLRPWLGLLSITVGIWLLLQINIWAGRVGALVGIGVLWQWFAEIFRQMAGFWLVALLLAASLLLLATTGIPPWLIRSGFFVGALVIGSWRWKEYGQQ